MISRIKRERWSPAPTQALRPLFNLAADTCRTGAPRRDIEKPSTAAVQSFLIVMFNHTVFFYICPLSRA